MFKTPYLKIGNACLRPVMFGNVGPKTVTGQNQNFNRIELM